MDVAGDRTQFTCTTGNVEGSRFGPRATGEAHMENLTHRAAFHCAFVRAGEQHHAVRTLDEFDVFVEHVPAPDAVRHHDVGLSPGSILRTGGDDLARPSTIDVVCPCGHELSVGQCHDAYVVVRSIEDTGFTNTGHLPRIAVLEQAYGHDVRRRRAHIVEDVPDDDGGVAIGSGNDLRMTVCTSTRDVGNPEGMLHGTRRAIVDSYMDVFLHQQGRQAQSGTFRCGTFVLHPGNDRAALVVEQGHGRIVHAMHVGCHDRRGLELMTGAVELTEQDLARTRPGRVFGPYHRENGVVRGQLRTRIVVRCFGRKLGTASDQPLCLVRSRLIDLVLQTTLEDRLPRFGEDREGRHEPRRIRVIEQTAEEIDLDQTEEQRQVQAEPHTIGHADRIARLRHVVDRSGPRRSRSVEILTRDTGTDTDEVQCDPYFDAATTFDGNTGTEARREAVLLVVVTTGTQHLTDMLQHARLRRIEVERIHLLATCLEDEHGLDGHETARELVLAEDRDQLHDIGDEADDAGDVGRE